MGTLDPTSTPAYPSRAAGGGSGGLVRSSASTAAGGSGFAVVTLPTFAAFPPVIFLILLKPLNP